MDVDKPYNSISGIGDQSHLRGDNSVVFDHSRRSRGVLEIRRLVLFRLHLLLFHHPNDHRLRRHGRATEGQRVGQQARVRHVRLDLHPLWPGHRRSVSQPPRLEIRDDEHRRREAGRS